MKGFHGVEAVTSVNHSLSVFSQLTFDLLWNGAVHECSGLEFSPDGRWLAGICDGHVRVWSLPDGELKTSFLAGGKGLAWTASGDLAVGNRTSVTLISLPSGSVIRKFGDQGHPINAVAASFDGALIAGADYQKVHLWDVADGSPRAVLQVHRRVVPMVTFSPNGNHLLTRSYGDAGIWTLTGERVADLSGKGRDGTGGFAVSPQGTIATSTGNTIFLFDGDGVLLTKLETEGYVWSLAFDRRSELLAVGFASGPIHVMSLGTNSHIATLRVQHGVQNLTFSPEGTLAAGQNGEIYLWSRRPIGKGGAPRAEARYDDSDLDQRLERVRKKVASRKLAMNKLADAGEVEGFERRTGVRLPEGYRRFIIEVANGGDGPGGVLLPLRDSMFAEPPSNLRKPFPLADPWIWEADEHATPDGIAAAGHGRLFLVEQGCGMYWVLIVSGVARNQVWSATDVGVAPCNPRRDFLSWFEYWLDGGHEWWE